MIKVKYNELFQHSKTLEEKISELESAQSHTDSPLCPCSQSPPSNFSQTIDYKAIIQSLECKILEMNKQIIEQNRRI